MPRPVPTAGPGTGPHRERAARGMPALPAVLVLAGAVSVQSGAGLASRLFAEVPPAAVTTLRLWAATVILAAVAGRGAARAVADLTRQRAWADAGAAVSFGIGLGLMNFSIYQAFARIPLGVAVTVEFLGPLAVAVTGTITAAGAAGRRLAALAWAALAAAGVVLLARGPGSHLNLAGVGWALASATGWAAYIAASKATGQRVAGAGGLVIAMTVAAAAVTVPGVAAGGRAMFRPRVLGQGAGIGLLSSVIPYGLDFEALRRVPARVFGVWMSLQPAVAALIGLAMLGQRLTLPEWAGIGCVVAASAGAARGAPGGRGTGETGRGQGGPQGNLSPGDGPPHPPGHAR